MPTSNDAISFLGSPDAPALLRWVNPERRSTDWKVKIFQHDATGLQLAIYDRAGIFALLEHTVTGISGVKQLPRRPKSDALKSAESKFEDVQGFYYEIADLTCLGLLISKYLNYSENTIPEDSTLYDSFDEQVTKSLADTAEDRRSRLQAAPKKPQKIKATTTVFVRNADVVAEVLHRANGTCQGCEKQAPFSRRTNGEPYLEVHHKTPLAQNGDDTILNAIALCPNCHRRYHYG